MPHVDYVRKSLCDAFGKGKASQNTVRRTKIFDILYDKLRLQGLRFLGTLVNATDFTKANKKITPLIRVAIVYRLIFNMSSTFGGKHLHVQACEMAFNVYQWIKSQNEDQCTKEIKEKLSRATGVSVRTIENIIKEGSTSPEAETDKRFKSPEKKKTKSRVYRDPT
ncbi:hypothetical protein FQA39_LY04708 [Lamprigera yunnana]|nr:hypothetical protein FQA39_LY04708 [Lamprigera yunnana]